VSQGNTILLVEDREEDIILFKHALESSELPNPLYTVHDGVEALAYLTRQPPFADRSLFPPPQIVLLDLNLPRVDGWQVLQAIRSRRRFDKLLVIVVTASLRVDDLRRAYTLGANSFLTKPCSADDLRNLAAAFPDHWFEYSGRTNLTALEMARSSLARPDSIVDRPKGK